MEVDSVDAAATDEQQEEVQLPPAPHLPEPKEDEPPPEDAAMVAVAAAVDGEIDEAEAVADPPSATAVLEENMRKIKRQQVEQTQLIVNMQSMINDLSAKQNELEEEIEGLKGGRWIVKAEPATKRGAARGKATPAQEAMRSAVGGAVRAIDGATTDDDVDAIIRSRKERKLWPLKRKYATCYTREFDLLRLRFHRSDKYPHKSVRIPKVDKNEGYGLGNREGRLICRLCSGKTINRNTSWMCTTCLVPLCVDIVNGDPESSCHARWHGCQDLVAVNATLNMALRERRESKKRTRDGSGGGMSVMEPAEEVATSPKRMRDAGGANIMQDIHEHEAVAVAVAALPEPEPMMEAIKVEVAEEQQQEHQHGHEVDV